MTPVARRRKPEPDVTVRAAIRLMPHEPGVYIFRNQAGRVVYIGRSGDLAARVGSYWGALNDRPHLRRMVALVKWVEPVLCASEHEAAFLETDLLARHSTRFNRTLGMESRVWIRVDSRPEAPSLRVEHDPGSDDGAIHFGPYLGWEPARQAAMGLQRLYPLRYSGTEITRSDRELGRSLGVATGDRAALVRRLRLVLTRDHVAVGEAIRELERMRDLAAERLMFEYAASLRENIRGLQWISQKQKLGVIGGADADYGSVASVGSVALLVVLELRGGSLRQRRVSPVNSAAAWPNAPIHSEWEEQARRNAELICRLAAADALGPVAWRVATRP